MEHSVEPVLRRTYATKPYARESSALVSMSVRRLVSASALLLLTLACGGRRANQADQIHLALSPSAFPERVSLQQHVDVDYAGRQTDFDAVLDIAPEAMTLVGLKFGQRIFTIKYDGSKLEESRSMFLPRDVRARDVLSDLQLALWPADAVRDALPAGWTLRDSDNTRVLAKGAEDVTTITYDGSPRWIGTILLDNRALGYRLKIRSIVTPS